MLFPGCGDCCQNPPEPPDFCICPDECIYYVTVAVSGYQTLSNRQTQPCVDARAYLNPIMPEECDTVQEPSILTAFVTGTTYGYTTWFPIKSFIYDNELRAAYAYVSIGAQLVCYQDPENSHAPKFKVRCWFYYDVYSSLNGYVLLEGAPVFTGKNCTKLLEISPPEDECAEVDNKFRCGDSLWTPTFANVSLPLELVISENDVNGIPWETNNCSSFDNTDGIGSAILQESGLEDCILNSFSPVTVTFARRTSCREKTCGCSESLLGMVVRINGGELDDPVEFTYGTADEFTYEDDDGWRVYSYTGGENFYVYYYKDATGENAVETKFVTLFCDTTGDPAVSKWYAIFDSACAEYGNYPYSNVATAATGNQEIGYFVCYEASGCGDFTEGDAVPLGSPLDVEQVEGYPQVPGGVDPCEPPARATIELVEPCGS